MKKLLKKAGTFILVIVMIPVLILCGIILLLCIPVDFVCYHRSAFYKDTRRKYELFASNSHWVQLYNAMRGADLPLDFYMHSTDDINYGYFRYQNTLLVQDFPVVYEPKKREWFVYHEDEDEEADTSLAEALEMSLESFHEVVGEKLCNHAVMLVDRTHIPEDELPHLEGCPLLLSYDGKKGMADAIKLWIEKN